MSDFAGKETSGRYDYVRRGRQPTTLNLWVHALKGFPLVDAALAELGHSVTANPSDNLLA
jgi:deoxyribodipyrimidine photolyase